ncbi:LysR family transcriptional regulator [Burkholderia ubonensis]|uniref:LysR family transcriptional regulator n=2 Tax=Burkholderia ubonensis TaxID=101571 RepID=A0A124L5D7_9BURK|nr:LysR family transcriptional regulator [Burkholderia ubonensis]KUZ77396.1 LysR family transcriptional regulator [Burkholderia ubonensis]KUZ91738.1 LysR family transcriptional regulator [Burkholderia ubonensis]KUZ91951.1 LysR family transcriptional regulator [Burkholderia ubonensis]KUZ95989.1 LysR family transcriptional regulator [Burkholderia ubonensis]
MQCHGNLEMQFKLSAADLETILTLSRTGTLAQAGERLGVDASTVFRSLQRVERGLEQRLFERTRAGYRATELALALAEHAEQVEVQIESARSIAQQAPEQVAGTVRITTTDTILHALVGPALQLLEATHPLLAYELHTSNEMADLGRRDADIAVRATTQPPEYLVGKHVGPIQVALFASRRCRLRYDDVVAGQVRWIAPDDDLPGHPSVIWRKRNFRKVVPHYKVNSIVTVMELVALGMGVGILPTFLTRGRTDLVQLTDVLHDCQTELWVLTHRESRHLRRVSAVFRHLASTLKI